MTFFKTSKFKWIVIILAIIIAAVLIVRLRGRTDNSDVDAGVSYLKSLEQQDPSAVENTLQKQRQQRIAREAEEKLSELTASSSEDSGETVSSSSGSGGKIWSLFGDSVIMGDSRAVGFYYFDFLPESRVLAGGGDTIRNIQDHLDEAARLNPQFLFLCYGLNDTSIGYWPTAEDYADEYRTILKKVQSALPNTKIFVNSILPATAAGIATEGSWVNIPEYSEAVHKMCEKEGYGWVDCDKLAADHEDMYQPDGVHVVQEFYPLWAREMMKAVYTAEIESADGGSDSSDGDKTGETVTSASS